MRRLFYLSFLLLVFSASAGITNVNAQSLKLSDPADFRVFTEQFISPFILISRVPKDINEFVRFELDCLPDQDIFGQFAYDYQGDVRIRGFLLIRIESTTKTNLGRWLKFESSKVTLSDKSIQLSFATKKFKGVQYTFEGQYFDTGVVYPVRDSTRLEGTLTKIKKGKKIAEGKISLYPNRGDVD